MKKQAKKDGLDRALCLLIVFGSEEEADQFEGDIAITHKDTRVSDLLMTGVVAKAIRVPTDDMFGLGTAFNARFSSAQIEAELFASHPYLKAHGSNTAELKAENALRIESNPHWKDTYDGLRAAMTGPLPEGSSSGASSKAKQSPKKKKEKKNDDSTQRP
jgi:hypothetical protein